MNSTHWELESFVLCQRKSICEPSNGHWTDSCDVLLSVSERRTVFCSPPANGTWTDLTRMENSRTPWLWRRMSNMYCGLWQSVRMDCDSLWEWTVTVCENGQFNERCETVVPWAGSLQWVVIPNVNDPWYRFSPSREKVEHLLKHAEVASIHLKSHQTTQILYICWWCALRCM